MKRATLAIAALAVVACLVGTASAAGGTQAALAANVSTNTVGFYPYGFYRRCHRFTVRCIGRVCLPSR
jgi:hypothetical protein